MSEIRANGRKTWFQIHKWIGLILLVVLIPISASGSLLVWHDWTDSLVNPQRYAVGAVRAGLPPEDYLAAAHAALQTGDRIASIDFPREPGKPVVVAVSPAPAPGERAQPGPPARYQLWLDPADARLLDKADARGGLLRTLHVFHGNLMVPGVGRTIVGWLGVAMFLSCLTGIILWWPSIGGVARGLRWNRGPLTSGNIHHQLGIWIVLPLAILSLTGAVISFPSLIRAIEGKPAAGAPRPPDRRARPAEVTALSVEKAIGAAREKAGDADVLGLRWPTEKSPDWTVSVARRGLVADYRIDDASGTATAAPPPRGLGRFMRQLHDGTDYNVLWQTIIFLAGFAPAVLGITGIIMWLRTRGWRARAARRGDRREPASDPQASAR